MFSFFIYVLLFKTHTTHVGLAASSVIDRQWLVVYQHPNVSLSSPTLVAVHPTVCPYAGSCRPQL